MPARSALVAALGFVLTSLGPAYAALLDHESLASPLASIGAPQLDTPWREAANGQSDDWAPLVFGADRTLLDAVTDGEVTIHRFVAYYVAHGRVNNLIRSDNRVASGAPWRIASRSGVVRLASGQDAGLTEIVAGDRRRLVLSYYVVDGATTASAFGAKLYQLRGLFSRGPQLSAFVAIAVDAPAGPETAMAAASRLLSAMQTFPSDLRALAQR